MTKCVVSNIVALVSLTGLAFAQGGRGGPANKEAPVTDVPFARILKPEPQNWLSYSGGTMSQRHSALTQVTPANAKDLTLKWVFQTRTLDKQENTPLVVDGVMYTIQSPNDVIALDAATGKTLWTYLHKPAAGTVNPCCGNLIRRQTVPGDARCADDRNQCQDRQGTVEDGRRRLQAAILHDRRPAGGQG
jgi:glucose dehydrogenase